MRGYFSQQMFEFLQNKGKDPALVYQTKKGDQVLINIVASTERNVKEYIKWEDVIFVDHVNKMVRPYQDIEDLKLRHHGLD